MRSTQGGVVVFFTYASESTHASVRSVYRTSTRFDESFHWLEAGSGNDQTLILIHGYLAQSFAFRKVVDDLARDYRVIVPDLPAHGRDETYRSEGVSPEISDLIDWFEHFLEMAVGDEPLYVAGHSLGALLCFIAGREQGRFYPIEKITLISPGVRIGLPPWTSKLFENVPTKLASIGATKLGLRLYEPIQWRKSRMNRREAARYVEPMKQEDRLEFMLQLGADLLSEPDRLPGAHRVDVPTMIITGEKDHLLPVETVGLVDAVIPDSRMNVLEGVGHCPMEDTPAEFLRLTRRFLAK